MIHYSNTPSDRDGFEYDATSPVHAWLVGLAVFMVIGCLMFPHGIEAIWRWMGV